MGGSMMRESEIYKGYCREAIPSDANNWVEWMLSVGYLGFFNFPDYDKTNGQLRLMECTHGDEVLYYDASLIDCVTPPDENEARKNRLDFSHTIKSQPKVKALSHKVNEENETLSGEYSTKELFVNLLPLKGKYNVTLTDAGGKVVYAKQVQTDNVLALNTDIARYPAGTYTLTVENDNESYEASFTIEGTGVEPIHNAQCIIHNDGNAIYDLQGRRLNKESLPKGVYIVNGKKLIIK